MFCAQGYLFSPNNPYRDQPNAFLEGQERGRQGDLTAAVLLLEAAIFQDPQDYEVMSSLPVVGHNRPTT